MCHQIKAAIPLVAGKIGSSNPFIMNRSKITDRINLWRSPSEKGADPDKSKKIKSFTI